VKHYDIESWALYRNNRIDENQRRLMENHLAVCDSCLKSYLAAAAKYEIRLGELLLPPDFNVAVNESIKIKKQQAARRRRSRSLANYTVAAAITLALMSGGIFDLCTRELPDILASTQHLSRAIEQTAHWDTGQLLETARAQLEKLRENKEE
jgi:predicted anti-sigma-YlaC factor YlaD